MAERRGHRHSANAAAFQSQQCPRRSCLCPLEAVRGHGVAQGSPDQGNRISTGRRKRDRRGTSKVNAEGRHAAVALHSRACWLGRSHRGRAADHLQLGRRARPTADQPFKKHLRRPFLPQAPLHGVEYTGATSPVATAASLTPHKTQPSVKARCALSWWHATTASVASTPASTYRRESLKAGASRLRRGRLCGDVTEQIDSGERGGVRIKEVRLPGWEDHSAPLHLGRAPL
eukprot:scaffold12959_cov116-Isochrysis_galbana.AAC.12